MLRAAFSVKQRINVEPSGQPEKKAPGSDWHAPRKERSAGFTGALWVQVRMECSTKQENGLGKLPSLSAPGVDPGVWNKTLP